MNEETKTVDTQQGTEKETVMAKAKKYIKSHKGAFIGGIAGSVLTLCGLLYLGNSNSEAEAVEEATSPMDE